jgi:hypothetical protein
MISRGLLSTINDLPTTALSEPNFESPVAAVSTTVSGVAGVSSAFENRRPSIGCTPSIGKTPSVANRAGTSSGSARPVMLTVPVLQSPTSWKTRPSSR